jgi:peptide chain release factor 1
VFKKLDDVELRYSKLQNQLHDTTFSSDPNKLTAALKENAELEPIVKTYREYKKATKDLESNKGILQTESDEELREMAKEEIRSLEQTITNLEKALTVLLLPKDPNDEKNIILEIRAGAGGDEASLFAEELFSGYCHYASKKGWRVEVLSESWGNVGGYKEVIAMVRGDKVYSKLKYESGVHRVQRVPRTETQGRVHTSTVTVAVIPEAEEVDVKIEPKELRIDVFRSSGKGGQSVNTTDSAVRVTHLPTGMIVSCQDEKSQHKNKEKALKVLYSRLLQIEQDKAQKSASDQRLAQIGTGDRSERIRTYNFPQSRMTDHRIGLTVHSLTEIVKGDFDQVVEPLIAHFQAEAMKMAQ